MVNRYYNEKDYMIGKLVTGECFKFDIEDFEFIKKYTWYITNQNQIVTTHGKPLTRLLLQHLNLLNNDRRILHKNNDSLDCRKENLFNGSQYVFYDDYVEGTCFDGRTFKIDKDDYELISKYVWHIDKNQYVITKYKGRTYKQHRLILNLCDANKNIEVDHIHHDTTDNRKSELRTVDRSENCINRALLSNNKSGTTGIYWCSSANKWAAQISYKKIKHYLGVFDNLDEAIAARKVAERQYHKEFSYNK